MGCTIDSRYGMKLKNQALAIINNERNDSLGLDQSILSNDHRNRSCSGTRAQNDKAAVHSGRNQATRTQRTLQFGGEHQNSFIESSGAHGVQPNRQLAFTNPSAQTSNEYQYRLKTDYPVA